MVLCGWRECIGDKINVLTIHSLDQLIIDNSSLIIILTLKLNVYASQKPTVQSKLV